MTLSDTSTAGHLISDRLVTTDGSGAPRLLAGRCESCHALSFPRADVCGDCLSTDIGTIEIASQGTLYSYSVVHQAPKTWKVPYVLGYVDLPEGLRVLAHIDAPPSEVAVDAKVKLSLGVVGTDSDGAPLSTYTFVPA